jgi:hypothetical protein
VTKDEFLDRWAKRATGDKSTESFERDVESLLMSTIRIVSTAFKDGMIAAAEQCPSAAQERILRDLAAAVIPAVESAIIKAHGIEEEGGTDAQGPTKGMAGR